MTPQTAAHQARQTTSTTPTPRGTTMSYNPTPEEQWTHSDLARAVAAKDYKAINEARRAGYLTELMAGKPSAESASATPDGRDIGLAAQTGE